MATEELKKENQAQGLDFQERLKVDNPAELLQKSIGGSLSQFGGFQVIKDLAKEADKMDPKRKATKNIFLNDPTYKEERAKLKNELAMWMSILEGGETQPSVIVDSCEKERSKAEQCLSTNLKKLHEEVQQLEVTYRTLDSFFANAGQGKIDCLTLMNVNKKELGTYNSRDTESVKEELEKYFDRLNLRKNYSILVLPGYLGDADTIRKWAKTAYDNKVIMVTDFMDSPDFDILKMRLDKANLQGQEASLGNVIMTCNYLFGRKKSEMANEEEDVFIPGSGALAGRLTDTEEIAIAQGAAGMMYGTLSNIKGARLDLRKAQIASLIDFGVIPMVEEDGRTMAFSNRSLYNGGTIGLKEYPIVRVFDWISKVIQSFFNTQAFRNWSPTVREELKKTVEGFLDDYKNGRNGCVKLIDDYKIEKIDQDPESKDIDINVRLKPFFAAKNFFITLKGHNDSSGNTDWKQDVK